MRNKAVRDREVVLAVCQTAGGQQVVPAAAQPCLITRVMSSAKEVAERYQLSRLRSVLDASPQQTFRVSSGMSLETVDLDGLGI